MSYKNVQFISIKLPNREHAGKLQVLVKGKEIEKGEHMQRVLIHEVTINRLMFLCYGKEENEELTNFPSQ